MKILIIGFFFFSQNILASNPVYETTVTEKIFNSSSKTVLTQDDIKKSGAETVTQLLSTQANISISSNTRRENEIFLRGGDGSHILIIVDGVPIYDGTSSQRSFNLNFLNLSTIRKIEILRGSQSVLYGGQALSGVIKISTFARELSSSKDLAVDEGSFNYLKGSYAQNINLNEEQSVFVSGMGQTRNNPSPVENSSVTYTSRRQQADLGFTQKKDWSYFLRTRYINENSELPGTGFTPYDTTDFTLKSKHLHSSLVFEFPDIRNTQIVFGHQQSQKNFDQPVNSVNPSLVQQEFSSQTFYFRLDTDVYHTAENKVYFGSSASKEFFKSTEPGVPQRDVDQSVYGIYLKWDHELASDLQFSSGVRGDWLAYQNAVTYQMGLTYNQDTRLEYATAVKSPSLFQKYAFGYGNVDLKPETSATSSLSQDFHLQPILYSVTLFDTYFGNNIVAQGSPQPVFYNLARTHTKGIENLIEYTFDSNSKFSIQHNYQEAWDIGNAKWLDRRSLQSGSFNYSFSKEKNNFSFQLNGESEKSDQGKRLAGYVTPNVFYSHQATTQLALTAKALNLSNQKVEQSIGYFSEGAQYIVGLEYFN